MHLSGGTSQCRLTNETFGSAIYPLETQAICPKENCGIKRTIRRALYFVSSKTVGGVIRPLNSLPETGKTKEFRGF